jgi:hypothetical protein
VYQRAKREGRRRAIQSRLGSANNFLILLKVGKHGGGTDYRGFSILISSKLHRTFELECLCDAIPAAAQVGNYCRLIIHIATHGILLAVCLIHGFDSVDHKSPLALAFQAGKVME